MSGTVDRVSDLVHWRDVRLSGLAFGAGLVFFVAVGAFGWSSLGTVCLLLSLHLLARLAYYNTVGVRPEAPAEWLSEAEVATHLQVATARLNEAARLAFALACCHDNLLTVQWAVALGAVALACRVVGTTGFLFLLFAAAFSLPKAYELKKAECDAAMAAVRKTAAEACGKAIACVPSIPKAADLAGKSSEAEAEKKKL